MTKNIQVQFREQIPLLLEQLGLNGIGIEVGVAEGEFSECILKSSKLRKLFLLDVWQNMDGYEDLNNLKEEIQEKRYLEVLQKMEGHGNRVTVIRGDCNRFVKYFNNNFFDFVYLDANHVYSEIKRQLYEWHPKVKVGGLFAGHDYMEGKDLAGTIFGVKSAVDEFVKELGNVKLYVTTDDTPFFPDGITPVPHHLRYFSWYFRKTE